MVLRRESIKQRIVSKSKLLFITTLGVLFLAVPIVLIFVNPLLIFVNYQLRVANGSMIHSLLLEEIEGAKLFVYLFNITNGERFLAGDDDKLKVQEVGPFVYQEYRTNDDLEIDREPGIMRYTPHHRMEFITEESIGRPEDTYLVLPNIALLSMVQIFSKYPPFFGQLFKMYVLTQKMKALSLVRVSDYLWGDADPIIKIVNSIVPGLIYFKSTGLMTRLYDPDAQYRLTLGTSDAEKFQVKKVHRFGPSNSLGHKVKSQTIFESTINYTNAYEGMLFPPQMTPETPISLYRYAICKSVDLQMTGSRQMEYGSNAFSYTFANSTFNSRTLCGSNGWCPYGILDLSSCFFGFPFAISKGHFLDTEPKMFEKVEGLKPNRSLHDNTFLIDPNVGVSITATISAQMNLGLGDMGLMKETKSFSDMFLPVSHTIIRQPKLRDEATSKLRLIYVYGPYMVMAAQCACAVAGIALLVYAANMFQRNRTISNRPSIEKTVINNMTSTAPLLDWNRPLLGVVYTHEPLNSDKLK